MAELLILGLSLIGIGFLYLRVVQPILVDFKIIPPRGGPDVAREVMLSSDASATLLSGTSNRDAPDTNQLEPVLIEPVRTSSERLPYHATSDDFVVWLAIIRVDGKQISANKIADMVGGTRADILEKVRGVRPQVKLADDAPIPAAARPGYEPYQDGGKPPQHAREALGLK